MRSTPELYGQKPRLPRLFKIKATDYSFNSQTVIFKKNITASNLVASKNFIFYESTYASLACRMLLFGWNLERVAGIGPASSAWKAEVLPLYHTRITMIAEKNSYNTLFLLTHSFNFSVKRKSR